MIDVSWQEVVQGMSTGLAVAIFFHVIYHRRWVAWRKRESRRRQPSQACGQTIAYGNGHRATCLLPTGHEHDHATTLNALKTVGYTQTPF